jgi:ParB-like chromosome segregation protein Spo0J
MTADLLPSPAPTGETIGAYPVHPAASLFPLMEGDAFTELVESIRQHGVRQPVVLHDGMLVDGRNRCRAVKALDDEGVQAANFRAVELHELGHGTENVVEWIYTTNKIRRHMTPDALAVIAAEMLPRIEAETAVRQKASQFQKGKSGNPSGKSKQVTKKSSSPARRDRRKSDARTTAGRVANMSGTSLHKGRQAVTVVKAAEAGDVSPADIQALKEGKKKLPEVVPPAKGKSKKAAPAPEMTLDEQVVRAWEKFKTKNNFAIADLPEIRQIVKRIIKTEEKAHG